jgi:hypothetical protein
MFQVVPRPANSYSALCTAQNAASVKWIKRCFKVLLALGTHFLPSVRPKMRLGRGRESGVSRGRAGLQINFLYSARQKSDLRKVGKAMFQHVAWPCELILCLLVAKKCDLGFVSRDRLTANLFSASLQAKNAF